MSGDYRYFRILPEPLAPGRKTRSYSVVNRTSGDEIGSIRWYPNWRQYCFFPAADTVWSVGCLADVQDFIKRLMLERKTAHDPKEETSEEVSQDAGADRRPG